MKEERKIEKKENLTVLQKPNVEAEDYNNNRKCTEYTHTHTHTHP